MNGLSEKPKFYFNATLWVVGLVFVSLGQSACVASLSIGAAMLGYACFWKTLFSLTCGLKERFWIAALWFAAVQATQLSWLSSSEYMGPLIWVVYICLVGVLGIQFGCLIFLFPQRGLRDLSFVQCLAISGCWVLLEWTRLWFFTGFTWNPVGLSLADSSYAIQWASVVGVYGLSFWVIFVNVLGLYGLKSRRRFVLWAAFALFPYLFGLGQESWVSRNVSIEKELKVALVQTAILPEQKDFFIDQRDLFIPFLDQWVRIWKGLEGKSKIDLIVLPEAVVGAGANTPIYSAKMVKRVWENFFGIGSFSDLPRLEAPFAVQKLQGASLEWYVSNAYIAQAMANHFQSDVIAGFETEENKKHYNSALHFHPDRYRVQRYAKRVLVPVGEYIPLSGIPWISQFLLSQFGVADSFAVGEGVELYKAFGDVPGRIRAAEHGVCVLRACNTGITGAIDCCGKVIEVLAPSEDKMDVLILSLPVRSFPTLYTWWGDRLILSCSVFFLLLYFVTRFLFLKVWIDRFSFRGRG
jgi:apolipoprotein N-acyltransferase